MRINISSGAPWEAQVGYSRAVRIGNTVEVSGTTAVDEHGAIVGEGDIYAQTVFILNKIERALRDAGASMSDVTRTRMFVKDIALWEKVANAHAERFSSVRPAATMVQVQELIHPGLLIEIEATAIIE